MEEEELHRYLHFILKNNEERFGIVDDSPDPNIRLNSLIDTLYKKTGKQVVVLIDEYDAPLLDVVHDKTKLEKLRNTMRNMARALNKEDKNLALQLDVEVRTPNGHVDLVLRSKTQLYLLELKLNQSSDAAMKQIDLKEYPKRFALCGLPIVKVGINFDMATHNIMDWKISCTK